MRLTPEQLKEYEENGFLMFPDLISEFEISRLNHDLERACAISDPRIEREVESDTPRLIRGLHDLSGPTGSKAFERLTRSPRILGPARDALGGAAVNVFHTKCNIKEAVDGAAWAWHQDYLHWKDDGAPAPAMNTALVMLDDATEIAGCLYFIRGSHKHGLLQTRFDTSTNRTGIGAITRQTIQDLCREHGDPVPITGKAGTVVLFHANLVHGSGHNMSAHARWHLYIVYNSVSNVLSDEPKRYRPEYMAARSAPALAPLDVDDIAA